MPQPNFILLYVAEPVVSARFYAAILASEPIEESPNFALFTLQSGAMLGLWSHDSVEPKPNFSVGGSELAFSVDSKTEVEEIFTDWNTRGLKMAQMPTEMDFGFTFVALDPDGHRLRVFAPTQQ